MRQKMAKQQPEHADYLHEYNPPRTNRHPHRFPKIHVCNKLHRAQEGQPSVCQTKHESNNLSCKQTRHGTYSSSSEYRIVLGSCLDRACLCWAGKNTLMAENRLVDLPSSSTHNTTQVQKQNYTKKTGAYRAAPASTPGSALLHNKELHKKKIGRTTTTYTSTQLSKITAPHR